MVRSSRSRWEEQRWCEEIDSLTFSPDSRRVAYVALWSNGEWFLVLDGEEQGSYPCIDSIAFTPDSQHVAHVAYREGRRYFVGNGVEYEQWDLSLGAQFLHQPSAYDRVFAPDGKRVAFVSGRRGDQ